MKRSILTAVFFICIFFNGFTQQFNVDSVISMLITDIEKEQIKNKGEFYPGMFYSFRGASAFPHNYQPDNNIFFTAIGNFTLKNLKSAIDNRHHASIDTILNRCNKSFSYFQQKDGLPFYNFWPRGGKIMPHSFIAQHLTKQFSISEDADDTIMILMSLEKNDSVNAILKKRMIEVSNKGVAGKRIFSTYKRFRNYKAFTTYLGYKMQTDFDFSVQCNMMYFSCSSGIPFSEQDSATLQLLAEMTKERLYMKQPSFISPYYGKSSLILYHLTRLIAAFHPEKLEAYKPIIIEDLKTLLGKAKTPIEKIILKTSLIRMGEQTEMPTQREIQEIRLMDQRKFSFFQARPAYWCRPWLKRILLHAEFVNYNFFSPTYDKILLLENLTLSKKVNPAFAFQ
jgi:hypothetical protein